MTGRRKVTGATSAYAKEWESIDWKKAEAYVKRLQVRIAKATQEGKRGKVKSLQWLLTHSFYAKALAVKKVTSNKGAKTTGIDKVKWSTPSQKMKGVLNLKRRGYKASPLRRVEIPKSNGKKRKLGIPTIRDRAMQALYVLALEPIAESTADHQSYGFRPHRACRDAIQQIFGCLCRKTSPQWIFDADIKACFDEIDLDWMETHLPVDKKVLKEWLRCGFSRDGKLFPSKSGTPQGGPASPILANMVLDGLQAAIWGSIPKRWGVNFIRYADDFIVTARDKETLVNKIIPAIQSFLKERGLQLSEEKCKIVHIDEGFNFLSQNVRKYNGKLLIKPAKEKVKVIKEKIKTIRDECRGAGVDVLIRKLNPVINGWARYHKHVVSSEVFAHLDDYMNTTLYRWLRKRHGTKKGDRWIRKRYYQNGKTRRITEYKRDKRGKMQTYTLSWFCDHKIVRHVKIKAKANPYDPEYFEYFSKRKTS